MNQLLESALKYQAKGYSIIPVNPSVEEDKGKKPLIKWEEFQSRIASTEEIKAWWMKYPKAMIGVVCGKISNLISFDADTPEAINKIEELVPDSLSVPTVQTPRGGRHYDFQYSNGIRNSNNGLLHTRGEGGFIIVPPSCRSDGKAYAWVHECAPPIPPVVLLKYLKDMQGLYYSSTEEKISGSHTESQRSQQVIYNFKDGIRDDSLFHYANLMVKGGGKSDEVLYVLEILAGYCDPPFPKNEVKEKIKSVLKRAERRERNIAEDLREWIEVTEGHFRVTDHHRESQVVTKEDKHAVIVAIKRFCEQGLIEKYGKERGVYRRVEKDCQEIDFLSVEDKPLQVVWPFEIERFVRTYPKNIVLIAGVQNAGKTGFLLNTAFENKDKFKINYFSSEMAAMELRIRLEKFHRPLKEWKSVNFRERSSNFVDVLEPDEVNIIDFLEITEDFYKIAAILKEIYEKLKNGIAIVAIQKDPKKEYGRGGTMGLEKPRLYLNIEHGKLEIIKAKNWANVEINPNGLYREFKIVQGAKFIMVDEWKSKAGAKKEYQNYQDKGDI